MVFGMVLGMVVGAAVLVNPFINVWYLLDQLSNTNDHKTIDYASQCLTNINIQQNVELLNSGQQVLNDVKFTVGWMFYLALIMYILMLLPIATGILAMICTCIGHSDYKETLEQIGEEFKDYLKAYKEFN